MNIGMKNQAPLSKEAFVKALGITPLNCIELEYFTGWKGEYDFFITDNLFFWFGMSKEAIDMIWELMQDDVISFVPETIETYMYDLSPEDGYLPALPIFRPTQKDSEKEILALKKKHWFPIKFCLNEQT